MTHLGSGVRARRVRVCLFGAEVTAGFGHEQLLDRIRAGRYATLPAVPALEFTHAAACGCMHRRALVQISCIIAKLHCRANALRVFLILGLQLMCLMGSQWYTHATLYNTVNRQL